MLGIGDREKKRKIVHMKMINLIDVNININIIIIF